jgi:exopolysaccharide biosynthesis protein
MQFMKDWGWIIVMILGILGVGWISVKKYLPKRLQWPTSTPTKTSFATEADHLKAEADAQIAKTSEEISKESNDALAQHFNELAKGSKKEDGT